MAKRIAPLHRQLPLRLRTPIEFDGGLFEPEQLIGNLTNKKKDQDATLRSLFNIFQERERKLFELARFFGLDPKQDDFWLMFTRKIAYNLLDGFQIFSKKKRHRKTEWTPDLLYILWFEMEAMLKSEPTIQSACFKLLDQERWAKHVHGKDVLVRQRTLEQWYRVSKKSSFVSFIKNIERRDDAESLNYRAEFYQLLCGISAM